ncbi:MAG: hypothetical protein IPH11_15195 [Ignavibacteriales bacterium]|nr:hypothetical protein [Ignavibacteriales bacterium]
MLNMIVKIPIRLWLSGFKKSLVTLFIITISFPVSAQLLSPTKILLTFSEPMSRETIFDPANYQVIANDNISVEVIKVGLVEGDSSVVLFFDKDEEWISFQITVHNLKDKAGNFINADKNVASIDNMLMKTIPITLLDNK